MNPEFSRFFGSSSLQAILAYDDMPRTQWIFKYSAQNTIVVSRTFFTQEVNEAFEELEEGGWLAQ